MKIWDILDTRRGYVWGLDLLSFYFMLFANWELDLYLGLVLLIVVKLYLCFS